MAYWDRISITKAAPEVVTAMCEVLAEQPGNAQSPHRLGVAASRRVAEARERVARLIHAESSRVIFTATGTESNNMAIWGMARAVRKRDAARRKILVSAIEHVSVMRAASRLEEDGFEVVEIPVDNRGNIDREKFAAALGGDVCLAAVQLANPEIGTIQDVKSLAAAAHEDGVMFHCDAVAAVGWMPVDVADLSVDTLSFSGAVFHGPPGAAALYIRKGVRVMPLLAGGVQERNLRSGTENVPAIVGFGVACELAERELPERVRRGRELAKRLASGLSRIAAVEFTGETERRLPGHVSVLVRYVEGEALLLMLDMKGISAASGSSCTAKDLKISPVLMALGIEHAAAQGSLVFSASRETTEEDVDKVVRELPEIVDKLRALSPLWNAR